MKIKIKKPDREEMNSLNVKEWPIWEKDISEFDWHYDNTEECFLIEGKASVETKDGKLLEFSPGDFITFPKGLTCKWRVKEPVKKHYRFKN